MNKDKKKNKKLPQKASAFNNQKQLRVFQDLETQVQHLSGDLSADNRIDVDDAEDNLKLRENMPAGGPFMHPMHDATADPQLDKKNQKRKPRR